MRLFSIIQWHHFAYMMISLALLGYGISGTVVSLVQRSLLPHYKLVYVICLLMFGLTSTGNFLIAQSLPLNAEEIFWDGWQVVYVLLIFLVLAIPFLFASTAICLIVLQFRNHVGQIYAVDLFGAGIGSLGIILMLYMVFPVPALIALSLLGLAASLIACRELQLAQTTWLASGIITAMIVLIISARFITLNISPYKSLQQTLRISGSALIAEWSSPLGLISIVANQTIPIRHAPGMSLNASQEPLPQYAVFTDADNVTAITGKSENPLHLAYLDQLSSALPYHLTRLDEVLILGAGGGADILQANYHTIPNIDAVELNPQLINLVNDDYSQFTGNLYQQKNLTLHQGEARGYLAHTRRQYDLIQLALMDGFNASSSGLYALNESYLYTVEALKLYLSRLQTNGYLAMTRWIKIPPRDTLKLFATAVAALKQSGVESPDMQLVLIRSWQTSTLLIKNGDFNTEELSRIKAFCKQRSFDIGYAPGIDPAQVNRYNRLKQPVFYSAAKALLSDQSEKFLKHYKFNIAPATDDRPFFHQFFKWSALPEILQLRNQGGMSLFESGYMMFIVTLFAAIVFSVALILLPVSVLPTKSTRTTKRVPHVKVVCYFLATGLAFLCVEIAMIQRFILFLHHPIYSIAVTLTSFLVFAGIGSQFSMLISLNKSRRLVLHMAVLAITLISLIYLLVLESMFSMLATLPAALKIISAIVLIAPLALFMGMPFPLAIASLSDHSHVLIPWAWGINGCASVISAVLATLLAIHCGFSTVLMLAVLLYLSVLLTFPEAKDRNNQGEVLKPAQDLTE